MAIMKTVAIVALAHSVSAAETFVGMGGTCVAGGICGTPGAVGNTIDTTMRPVGDTLYQVWTSDNKKHLVCATAPITKLGKDTALAFYLGQGGAAGTKITAVAKCGSNTGDKSCDCGAAKPSSASQVGAFGAVVAAVAGALFV